MRRLLVVMAFAAGAIAAGQFSRFGRTPNVPGAVLTAVMIVLAICTFAKGKDGVMLVLAATVSLIVLAVFVLSIAAAV